jgi:hypothetical protein
MYADTLYLLLTCFTGAGFGGGIVGSIRKYA